MQKNALITKLQKENEQLRQQLSHMFCRFPPDDLELTFRKKIDKVRKSKSRRKTDKAGIPFIFPS